MGWVLIQSDLDAIDERFVDAVLAVTGLSSAIVLDTWSGVDKETGEMCEDPPGTRRAHADIFIEWRRWPGRYGLEVSIFGSEFAQTQLSEMESVRSLARELKCPFLKGSRPTPWCYYLIAADGAVSHAHTTAPDTYPDPDEVFDLDDYPQPGCPVGLICSATEPWKS